MQPREYTQTNKKTKNIQNEESEQKMERRQSSKKIANWSNVFDSFVYFLFRPTHHTHALSGLASLMHTHTHTSTKGNKTLNDIWFIFLRICFAVAWRIDYMEKPYICFLASVCTLLYKIQTIFFLWFNFLFRRFCLCAPLSRVSQLGLLFEI